MEKSFKTKIAEQRSRASTKRRLSILGGSLLILAGAAIFVATNKVVLNIDYEGTKVPINVKIVEGLGYFSRGSIFPLTGRVSFSVSAEGYKTTRISTSFGEKTRTLALEYEEVEITLSTSSVTLLNPKYYLNEII